MLGSKVDAGYFDSLVHRGPESIGVLEKQKIKFPAIDVIRVILRHSQARDFAKADRPLLGIRPMGPIGAILAHEAGLLHLR